MILCGCACSAPSEGILKETKKKGKAKSAKGRKQKEDTGLQSCSVSQFMFCQYFASFYCTSAQMSLQTGKIEEANEVLLKAREILHCVENSVGYNPMHLLPMKASILYMSGVATFLLNKGSSKDVCVDCNWFPETDSKISSLESSVENVESSKVDTVEEYEVEKPRKASGKSGRNSKTYRETNHGGYQQQAKKAEEEATRHRRPWQNLMILNQVLIRRQRDVKDQQRNLPVLWMVMKQVRLLHLKLTYFIEDPSFSLFFR